MPVSREFRDYVVEQLSAAGQISVRSMFGGVGIYLDGYFFALIDNDVLYLKTDDRNRPDFASLGMEPFRPYGDHRTMDYHAVPADVLEDGDRLAEWAHRSVDAAKRSKEKGR